MIGGLLLLLIGLGLILGAVGGTAKASIEGTGGIIAVSTALALGIILTVYGAIWISVN
jgi:hypothetical protein